MTNRSIRIKLALLAMYWACSGLSAYGQAPDWTAPNSAEFDYSATVTAVLSIDGQLSLSLQDKVAFVYEEEIVGLSMPFNIGGAVYHFATVFANVPEAAIDILVYDSESDAVIEASTLLAFSHQLEIGSIASPFVIDANAEADLPILLNGIPAQRTVQGIPFAPVNLRPYLVQSDSDPITWTTSNNADLEVQIEGDTLFVEPVADFFGSTFLIVRATEQTVNEYSAATVVEFKVKEGFLGPYGKTFLDFTLLRTLPLQRWTSMNSKTSIQENASTILSSPYLTPEQ